jgi:uncharacterized protein YodC (DUF2158 family)
MVLWGTGYPWAPLNDNGNQKPKGKYVATAANGFKVGDTVMLRAGGPVMTVNSLPSSYTPGYKCQWFAGKKLESGVFKFEELLVAKPQPPIPAPGA